MGSYSTKCTRTARNNASSCRGSICGFLERSRAVVGKYCALFHWDRSIGHWATGFGIGALTLDHCQWVSGKSILLFITMNRIVIIHLVRSKSDELISSGTCIGMVSFRGAIGHWATRPLGLGLAMGPLAWGQWSENGCLRQRVFQGSVLGGYS